MNGETGETALLATLAAVDPADLVRFLATRRWFGAKGRPVASVALHDLAPIPGEPATLACVRVKFADGAHADHQLPLAIHAGPDPIATVGSTTIVDALTVPAIRSRLARAFARGETFTGPSCRWTFESTGDAILNELPAHLADGEQSNTSIIIGERAILKMYRRLEPGPHPEVEVGQYLTRAGFRGSPPLLGTARLDNAAGTSVTATIQRFMPGAVDGWSHVLAGLRAGDDLGDELAALGAVTREFHTILANCDDPEFAPESTLPSDLNNWHTAAATQARAALTTLAERQHTLPASVLPDVQRVLAHAGALITGLPAPTDPDGLGPRTRHHGDYHLGQVLRTHHGWQILDFEGEPARPLAERRIKHHPLRDIAGMLRSFAYAAAVATPEHASASERAMRTAFLAGYDPSLADDPRRADLLALFTAEKLFYELAYELGSRPTWVWIPLAGLTARL